MSIDLTDARAAVLRPDGAGKDVLSVSPGGECNPGQQGRGTTVAVRDNPPEPAPGEQI